MSFPSNTIPFRPFRAVLLDIGGCTLLDPFDTRALFRALLSSDHRFLSPVWLRVLLGTPRYSSVLSRYSCQNCWASFGTGFLEVWTFLRGFLPILRFSASPISAFPKKPVSVGVFRRPFVNILPTFVPCRGDLRLWVAERLLLT